MHAALTERMIGITAAQMRAVPEVIAIVYGLAKARAVLAAVRGGYVDGLVTHSTLAMALIAGLADRGGATRVRAAEIPLLGGTANRGLVLRVGDTVRRPLRPSAPGVHALLRHLEHVGFDGAPRFLGVDEDGREVLSYIAGDAVIAPAPDVGAHRCRAAQRRRAAAPLPRRGRGLRPVAPRLAAPAAAAARRGRDAAQRPQPRQRRLPRRPRRRADRLRPGGPGLPAVGRGGAARLWVPLRAPSDVADERRDRAIVRARILVDAYGLDEAGRLGLVDAVRASHDWMCGIVADGAAHGVPGFAAYWGPDAAARAQRTDAWLHANTAPITHALVAP